MMDFIWAFFMAHWLFVFWTIVGVAIAIVVAAEVFQEIRFRKERRRYQAARK